MAATTATALPSPSLLDRKIKHGPSKKGILAFVSALAAGVVYIVFHVAHDLNAVSITSYAPYLMLGLALVIALGFEFVNGFHDTANAIATSVATRWASRAGSSCGANTLPSWKSRTPSW